MTMHNTDAKIRCSRILTLRSAPRIGGAPSAFSSWPSSRLKTVRPFVGEYRATIARRATQLATTLVDERERTESISLRLEHEVRMIERFVRLSPRAFNHLTNTKWCACSSR
jgi:hypothetical protein